MISDERLEQFAYDKRMCNVTEEIVSMAKELLAYRKASNWIDCSERLPEGEEFVLAYWSHSGHVEDAWFAFDEDEPGQRYHVLYDGERMLQEPSHWMPLPPSPTN